MQDTTRQYPNFIRTPAQSTTSYLDYAEMLRTQQSITFGCVMDNDVIPPHPGDVISVIGRPGHGKTAFMSYMARRTAQTIIDEGKNYYNRPDEEPGEVVLYITWEQIIEEIEANMQAGLDYTVSDIAWGRANMDIVRKKAIGRPNTPIWVVGSSIAETNTRQAPMTFDAIFENIRYLKKDFNVVPKLILMDYLQIIPISGRKDRHEAVSEATHLSKELAKDVGCPIFLGVQAKETVDKTNDKIPGMADAYYTSSVAHVVDKNFGVMKASRVCEIGEKITIGKRVYTVDDKLFLVQMSKQRFEDGFKQWAFNFDMATMRVWDLPAEHMSPQDFNQKEESTYF